MGAVTGVLSAVPVGPSRVSCAGWVSADQPERLKYNRYRPSFTFRIIDASAIGSRRVCQFPAELPNLGLTTLL